MAKQIVQPIKAQAIDTKIYSIIIRGNEAKPAPINSKRQEAINTILNSFPLNFRFLNLKENIGILVISREANTNTRTLRKILELIRLSIRGLSEYSLASNKEKIRKALPGVASPLNCSL